MPVPVLMYHALVSSCAEQYHRTVITEQAFAEQMEWLSRAGYTSISLNEARQQLSSEEKYVVITFDDGYASTVRYALPILEKFGFRATLFLCTGGVGAEIHPAALIAGGKIPLEDKPLTTNEIEALRKANWRIEAHSVQHLNHAALDATTAIQEMEQSKLQVRQITGQTPTAYAFPFGAYRKETLRLCAQRYELACTTHQGLWKSHHALHRIPRIEVCWHDNLQTFTRKVETGYGNALQALLGSCKAWLREMF